MWMNTDNVGLEMPSTVVQTYCAGPRTARRASLLVFGWCSTRSASEARFIPSPDVPRVREAERCRADALDGIQSPGSDGDSYQLLTWPLFFIFFIQG